MTMQHTGKSFAKQTPARGFMPLYYAGESNHCPGCGGMHWHIGRVSAECARCETALPIAMAGRAYDGFEGELFAA